jgi:hypothetical protein
LLDLSINRKQNKPIGENKMKPTTIAILYESLGIESLISSRKIETFESLPQPKLSRFHNLNYEAHELILTTLSRTLSNPKITETDLKKIQSIYDALKSEPKFFEATKEITLRYINQTTEKIQQYFFNKPNNSVREEIQQIAQAYGIEILQNLSNIYFSINQRSQNENKS